MTFGFGSGLATFEKAVITDSTAEPSDRQLNRVYRSLMPILQPAERICFHLHSSPFLNPPAKEAITKASRRENILNEDFIRIFVMDDRSAWRSKKDREWTRRDREWTRRGHEWTRIKISCQAAKERGVKGSR
jgi:hypothetical protein